MPDRPIMFTTPLVRAILAGRKTQTRRVVKAGRKCCPYHVGQKLWVKETWARVVDTCDDPNRCGREMLVYRASTPDFRWTDGDGAVQYRKDGTPRSGWSSPRFMPKEVSRITLEVVAVRQEHVQEITEDDAYAEGISGGDSMGDPVGEFAKLWDSINAKRTMVRGDTGEWPADFRPYSWESNPLVDVVTSKVL